MAVINVAVTCTNGKRMQAPSELRLRTVHAPTLEKRAAEWARRLNRSETLAVAAGDLYVGQHWRTACSIAQAEPFRVNLWVCSAGYGLVPFGARLRPYSATFSEDNPDCVSKGPHGLSASEARRRWWKLLSKWKPFRDAPPRTLVDLVGRDPRSPLLVITSPKYLDAMTEDLVGALGALQNPDALVIVCAGADRAGPLEEYLLPCDDRLQTLVGGAKWALNVRIGKKVLEEAERWPLRASVLTKRYKKLLGRLRPPMRYRRVRMSDEEVRTYIRTSLREEPLARRSPQLRELREGGYACEQDRFACLFDKVQREINGR